LDLVGYFPEVPPGHPLAVAVCVKEAVALYADASTPVLVENGFPESKRMDWLASRARQSRMFAPLPVYPLVGAVTPLLMTTDSISR